MGFLAKKRAVRGIVIRWEKDLERLTSLFGDYSEENYDDGAEMQRNLGTAIAHALRFLARTSGDD